MEGPFAWVVVGSIVTMILVRLLQLGGFIMIVHTRVWYGICLLLIVLYFLIISGPVGYAKYRLPFEPVLIVLLAIGIKGLYRKHPKTAL